MPRTLDDLVWPLTTARLKIRRALADDLDAVGRYRCRDSVTMWMAIATVHFAERFVGPEPLRDMQRARAGLLR